MPVLVKIIHRRHTVYKTRKPKKISSAEYSDELDDFGDHYKVLGYSLSKDGDYLTNIKPYTNFDDLGDESYDFPAF